MENNKDMGLIETDTIKLIKNTKGYNWEIKLIGIDLIKLKKINDDLVIEYGVGE